MPFLTRPAGRIRYQVTGAGQPPLLLTHGFAATSATFGRNLARLAPRHHVVTWDMFGHGGSDSPATPDAYSAAAAVANMAALLDEMGIDRAVLGGHSLGGYLSLEFALAFPERVVALILIDTGPGYRNESARESHNVRAERIAARLEQLGLSAVESGTRLHGDKHQGVTGLAMAGRHTLIQRDAHVMDGLPNIAVPTLIVVGAEDTPLLGAADYMALKIPGARKVVISGASHAPNVDQPEHFGDELAAFLEELESL